LKIACHRKSNMGLREVIFVMSSQLESWYERMMVLKKLSR
jgi:hypothetical protein